ncbi:MAG: ParA family protein [Parcubacteria group bacterium]|nr:ParA family protein [Parcubacteria group bacterium]
MAKIIAICNQKGGVGKTTTAISLGSYLAALGRKTLLVDFDPQANATSGLGINYAKLPQNVYHNLIFGFALENTIQHTPLFGLDILPASPELIGAQVELASFQGKEYRLKELLNHVKSDYQYILIDLPPSLGLLTVNGLVAAEYVLIPIQTEFFALDGLSQLINTIDLIRRNLDEDLKILGAVLTLYDRRNRLDRLVVKNILRHFPGYVFNAIIPRNISLAEAPSFGQSILQYNPHSEGARAYRQLAEEVIKILESSPTV